MMRTRWTSWWRSAVEPRRAIARLLPAAGWPLVAGLAALDLVLGLLPVTFVLLTSVVVGQVPAAVETAYTLNCGCVPWR